MGSPLLVHQKRILILFLLCSATHLIAGTDPRALLHQADEYADAGNLDVARALYAQAEQAFVAQGDARNTLYAKFGRLRKDAETGAYNGYLAAVDAALNEPAVKFDAALRIRGLALRAQIQMNLNTSNARHDWQEIAQLASEIADKKWANRASGQLGIVAGLEGDYAEALSRLLAAIIAAQSLHDLAAEIYFKTFLGNGATVLGRAEQGLPLFQSAIDSAKKNPASGYPILPTIGKIRALTALRRRDEARPLIAEALEYSRKNDVLGAQAELLVQFGLLRVDGNDLRGAEAAFREAIVTAEKASLPRLVASGYSGLNDVYRARRNWIAAERAADEAIDALQTAEQVYDLPEYLAKKADLEMRLGHPARAGQLYRQATDIIEAMLVNMPSSLTKTSLIGSMSRVYTGHFRLAVEQLHNTAEAFAIIERARGRSLADSLRYGERAGNNASEWEGKISLIQQRIRRNRSPGALRSLLAQLGEAEANLAGVESERNRKVMREMALLNTGATSLKGLQNVIRPDEIVLEYVLDEPVSFCLQISATTAVIRLLDSRKRIEDAIDRHLAAIQQRKDPSETGRYLHATLLGTIEVRKTPTLIVVPDGKLHLLPFASLIAPNSKFLIESTNIFYAPSGNVLYVLRSHHRNHPPTKPFFGVAYSGTASPSRNGPEVATRGLFDTPGTEYRPLAFAREEVMAAAESVGPEGVVLTGASASEWAIKTAHLSDFRVLHFAAHAIEDRRRPERAGLVFYPGRQAEDGVWQPREIRREELRADLVVLSACETAVGKIEGEEGVANLARTFLIAGSRSVIASSWTVDDRATATMMAQMYSYLANGEPVATALRHAQIDMLRQFGSTTAPFYWAAFLVIGDGSRSTSFRSTNAYPEATGNGLR
jgi:CHAT domain-containing protein